MCHLGDNTDFSTIPFVLSSQNNQSHSSSNVNLNELKEATLIIERAYTYTYCFIDETVPNRISPGQAAIYSYRDGWLFVPLKHAITFQADKDDYNLVQEGSNIKNYIFYAAVKIEPQKGDDYWYIEQVTIQNLSEIKFIGVSDLCLNKEMECLPSLVENDIIDTLLKFIRSGLDDFYAIETADIYIGRYEELENGIIISVAIVADNRNFWDVFSVNLDENNNYYVFKPPMTDGAPFMENDDGSYDELVRKTILYNRFHTTIGNAS